MTSNLVKRTQKKSIHSQNRILLTENSIHTPYLSYKTVYIIHIELNILNIRQFFVYLMIAYLIRNGYT